VPRRRREETELANKLRRRDQYAKDMPRARTVSIDEVADWCMTTPYAIRQEIKAGTLESVMVKVGTKFQRRIPYEVAIKRADELI
jgi:hypothetical protein